MRQFQLAWHGARFGGGGKGRLKGRMILIHQKVSRAVAARRCHSLHSQPQHSQSRFFFQVVNGTGFWNRTIPRFWQCFWGQSLVLEPQKRVHVWFLAFTGFFVFFETTCRPELNAMECQKEGQKEQRRALSNYRVLLENAETSWWTARTDHIS